MAFRILIPAQVDGERDRVLEVDGTVREAPTEQSTPTQYPVGAGRTLSDHVQHLPGTLSVDILVTETPTRELEEPLAADHTIVATTRRFGETEATGFGSSRALRPRERARTLYESLDALRREARFLSVTTAIKHYGRMVITGITAPVEGPRGDLVISVEFQEISIAESRLETAQVVAVPRLRRRESAGSQSASEDVDGAGRPVQRRTALQALADVIGGSFE